MIDLYWAHGEDRSVPLEETVAAFGALVGSGAVRRLGVSNHPVWRVERARLVAEAQGVEPYSALQLTTSYVEPRPGAPVEGKDHRFGFVTDETVDYLAEHPDLELWVYSPLVQGSYDRADRPFPAAYDHPGTTARLAALASVASSRGVAASQVVLAWLLARGWKPIVGVSTPRAAGLRARSGRARALRGGAGRARRPAVRPASSAQGRTALSGFAGTAHHGARRLEDMSQTPNLAGLSAADRLLHQRIIVLGQEVDDPIANKLCAELLLLSAEDPRRDIALYINSPGGSVSAGLAIYDTMRLIPNDVATLSMGLAASMGQFLLSAGNAGQAVRAPAQPDPDAPGLGRHRRDRDRHRDPGREPRAHQERDDAADRGAHRPAGREDRAGRSTGPVVHRRGGA